MVTKTRPPIKRVPNEEEFEPRDERDTAEAIDVSPFGDDVPTGYIPEGFASAEEYLKDLREDHESSLAADHDNRVEAMDDKEFTAGNQWDPEVKAHRSGLPCLTINQIPQFTAQLVGDWRQSRNAIKVVPSSDGTIEEASIRCDLIRSIEVQSRADRVYDSAFESLVTCGDGAFRVSVEYARDDVFDQDIFIRPIEDCLSVVWDGLSIDPTGRDARYCFVEDRIPKKEFDRKWPGKSPSTLGETARTNMRGEGWFDDSSVRVVEHWRMIERDRLLGLFKNGAIHVLTAETMEKLKEDHGEPIKTRIAPCSYAQMHLVTGFAILAGPYEWQIDRLPIIRMTGRIVNTGTKRHRYGLVRFMKDVSRLRNFWRSRAAEQLGYAPNAQWIAPESAVAGREEEFRNAHLTRDPLLIFNDDATIPPQRLEPPAPQIALLNEAQINTQDMKDVTGIHDASLGIKSNETSGKAIMARQREGDIAAITYYDNGNAALLEAGSVINQLIGQIYDATRIIRVIGEDETPKLLKINDPTDPNSPNLAQGKYDVVLTSGSSYTTRRAEAADAMMQAIQVWPEIMQIAGDLVIKAQDWPGADDLAARLKKTIPPQLLSPEEQQEAGVQGGGDPAQSQALQQAAAEAQAQMQELMQENESLKTDNSAKMGELAIKAFEAETNRLRVVGDREHKVGDLTHKVMTTGLQHEIRSSTGKAGNMTPSLNTRPAKVK